ncbi:MAG TPA: biotin/lipoyl-binding protein [Candidatus Sericytochromatia bacterium]
MVKSCALMPEKARDKTQLLGQVEATEGAAVCAQTSSVIQKLLVRLGDLVAPGTTIAVLDDADQQLESSADTVSQERSNLA